MMKIPCPGPAIGYKSYTEKFCTQMPKRAPGPLLWPRPFSFPRLARLPAPALSAFSHPVPPLRFAVNLSVIYLQAYDTKALIKNWLRSSRKASHPNTDLLSRSTGGPLA